MGRSYEQSFDEFAEHFQIAGTSVVFVSRINISDVRTKQGTQYHD